MAGDVMRRIAFAFKMFITGHLRDGPDSAYWHNCRSVIDHQMESISADFRGTVRPNKADCSEPLLKLSRKRRGRAYSTVPIW